MADDLNTQPLRGVVLHSNLGASEHSTSLIGRAEAAPHPLECKCSTEKAARVKPIGQLVNSLLHQPAFEVPPPFAQLVASIRQVFQQTPRGRTDEVLRLRGEQWAEGHGEERVSAQRVFHGPPNACFNQSVATCCNCACLGRRLELFARCRPGPR